MSREDALAIVHEYVKNVNLVRHMLAVEAAMAAYAEKFGEDVERWRVAGLLHDFDYEIHPTLDEHPMKGADILREKDVDEEIIRTILSHADHSGVARENKISKALHACDDITGFIVAVALVRPNKKLSEVTLDSLKKKWKAKEFAKGVKREEVEEAAKELEVDLWEHMETVLAAMQENSDDLGL